MRVHDASQYSRSGYLWYMASILLYTELIIAHLPVPSYVVEQAAFRTNLHTISYHSQQRRMGSVSRQSSTVWRSVCSPDCV